MTANDRIEALLNRRGQTMADIPHSDVTENAKRAVAEMYGGYSEENALRYIGHCAEVIDRLEWALDRSVNK